MPELKNGLIVIESGESEQPYQWSVGLHGSKYLQELRDNKKLHGIKCPKCGTVYTPVRSICGPCFTPMTELVELKPTATLSCYTILRFAFIDPETGIKRPVPYAFGAIVLDGADNSIQHFIEFEEESDVKAGARLEAVFKEDRKGSVSDISHFRVV